MAQKVARAIGENADGRLRLLSAIAHCRRLRNFRD
jgi:hypothetical protein